MMKSFRRSALYAVARRSQWSSRAMMFVLAGAVVLGRCLACFAVEPATVRVLAPLPHQVVQREGFDSRRAHEHNAGGPALGWADVGVRIERPIVEQATTEFRIASVGDAAKPGEWMPLKVARDADDPKVDAATVRVPAGGWYRLETRWRRDNDVVALGAVEPFGVGEVFVVAGQSYATNTNDERLKVEDAHGRVVAFDLAKGTWRVAHDPQPAPDGSDGGSIWPAVGDLLVPGLRVPVGFANVAVGGTSSIQWQPNGNLHPRLIQVGKTLKRFRGVLWQQGESDVIVKTPTDAYVENIRAIRAAAAKEWGIDPPWFLAKSTLHPTVYNDPAGEARIRDGIDKLCDLPGFRHGPDTDVLGGENRGGPATRRHFSPIGQRRAAALWFATLWIDLNARPTKPPVGP